MKQLTNYQRVSNYLVKVFKGINEHYFSNELETPTITIQSTVGAYGHITTSKVWNNNGTPSYELNISADYLNRPIEAVVATLIHEATHLYCMMKGIKDTSNNGIYHNKRFKQIAEEIGHLQIDRHEKYGWTITSPTEDTIDFCIEYGFEDILINRESGISFGGFGIIGKGGNDGVSPIRPRRPYTNRKWFCPCCGIEFSAPRNLNVHCNECDVDIIPKPEARGRKAG